MPGKPPSPEKLRQKNLLYSGVLGYTATYRYGDTLRTLVARSKAECNMNARAAWGEWDGEPCYSNPANIYRDLTGETYQRHTRLGFHAAMTGRRP
jgi:hypothetical protein